MTTLSPKLLNKKEPNPYGIRTSHPTTWPQYPYNSVPRTPEQSEPRYTIQCDWNQSVTMRDGVKLLFDVYRPHQPGERFPALCSFSPYTRQLQRENNTFGQNEAGISEFWVSRGYAHVIVDVRGTNGSEGGWDWYGPDEQRDYVEVIEWVARQSWCNGNVGMTGCSYFAVSQNLAAAQQPPGLKAIFPYDCQTDMYRHVLYPGGIPHDGYARIWFSALDSLNFRSGRSQNTVAMTEHFRNVLSLKYPLDGPRYWEHSTWPKLGQIQTPAYFGCHWMFYQHLRGPFSAWMNTGKITKRMLIGPTPKPVRPFAAYHMEALRWYDHFLKGMDTGVLDGAPIHLWILGEEMWRDEYEWPLARTRWTEFYLGGTVGNGTLSDTPPLDGEQTLDYQPGGEQWLWGRPRWVYRSSPLDQPMEITGPIQLNLAIASSATDTDWVVTLYDEAPDGSVRELTQSWLRSSHRAVDPGRGRQNQPWHPHDRIEPLTPGKPEELQIEVIPACNVFYQGHRIRLELSNCDSLVEHNSFYKRTLLMQARNTVIQGRGKSRIILPVIPR
jgi:uncharacterized protein